MARALLALAIGAFGIGTTEFVMMGLLPAVADDLGISLPTAGHLVSAYAMRVPSKLRQKRMACAFNGLASRRSRRRWDR